MDDPSFANNDRDDRIYDIFASDYFLEFVLDHPDYWRLPGWLMQCDRALRKKIQARLPGWFKTMLQILWEGSRSLPESHPRDSRSAESNFYWFKYGDWRKTITKLFKSGVLPKYVKYFGYVDINQCLEQWTELSLMPISAATDWEQCYSILEKLPQKKYDYVHFAKIDMDGDLENYSTTSEIFQYQNKLIFKEVQHIRICNYYVESMVAYTPRELNAYRIESGDVRHSPITTTRVTGGELIIRSESISMYVNVIRFDCHRELIRRFCLLYGVPVPKTPDDYQRMANLLMFCALFDLDFRILSAEGPAEAH